MAMLPSPQGWWHAHGNGKLRPTRRHLLGASLAANFAASIAVPPASELGLAQKGGRFGLNLVKHFDAYDWRDCPTGTQLLDDAGDEVSKLIQVPITRCGPVIDAPDSVSPTDCTRELVVYQDAFVKKIEGCFGEVSNERLAGIRLTFTNGQVHQFGRMCGTPQVIDLDTPKPMRSASLFQFGDYVGGLELVLHDGQTAAIGRPGYLKRRHSPCTGSGLLLGFAVNASRSTVYGLAPIFLRPVQKAVGTFKTGRVTVHAEGREQISGLTIKNATRAPMVVPWEVEVTAVQQHSVSSSNSSGWMLDSFKAASPWWMVPVLGLAKFGDKVFKIDLGAVMQTYNEHHREETKSETTSSSMYRTERRERRQLQIAAGPGQTCAFRATQVEESASMPVESTVTFVTDRNGHWQFTQQGTHHVSSRVRVEYDLKNK